MDQRSVQQVLNEGYEQLFEGNYRGAEVQFSKAFAMARGQGYLLDGAHSETPFRIESIDRLIYSIEQMRYLIDSGRISPEFRKTARAAERFVSRHRKSHPGKTHFIPTTKDEAELRCFLGKCFSAYRPRRSSSGVLLAEIDSTEISRQLAKTGHAIVDDVLTSRTLESLRRFCNESAIWHDMVGRDYVTSHLHGGFYCGLLFQVASDLKRTLPGILGNYSLNRMWGNRYLTSQGTPLHADPGKISLTLWITPDQANLQPGSGGIVIYRHKAPPSWTHAEYTSNARRIQKALPASDRGIRVPYRCNRLVLFDASRFHRTDRLSFAEGFSNHRTGITFIFGDASRLSH